MDSEQLESLEMIIQGSELLGIDIGQDATDRMITHLNMLDTWRNKAGLTSMKRLKEMALFHFLDSLTLFKVVPRGTSCTFLDVGTGGGFPGIVLAEVEPAISLTVLDRDPRKIVFLKHLVHALKLVSVRFLNQTLGSLLESPHRPLFNYVASRAFSSDPGILESLARLVVPGGGVIHMGGPLTRRNPPDPETLEESDRWEGHIPFSNRERIVSVYRKKAR